MRISLNWLKNYIDIPASAEDIAKKLSSTLAEVEEIEYKCKGIKDIYVGEIIELEQHPNADKLRVAKVDIKTKTLQIVCGAPNIALHQKVPVVIHGGATIEGKIEKTILRGVESEGMLCSPRELGISNDHLGIFILPQSTEVGEKLDDLLTDTIFIIENKALTHRPDCFSHLGIAREIAAAFDIPFEDKNLYQLHEKFKNTIGAQIKTVNCLRYSTVEIRNITVEPSPLWLQIRLLYTGFRPVNNIVDITNYVMQDIGQPLHAFDKEKIGNTIIIRDAKKQENFTTLDEKSRVLDETMMVIATPAKAIALAGIMGGKDSEISDDTKTIVLESANFQNINLRKTAWSLGLHTDAGLRFEKNIDPNLTLDALKKATEMLDTIAKGESSSIADVYPHKVDPIEIHVPLAYIKRLTGLALGTREIESLLHRLTLESRKEGDGITISIPTFRRDLHIPADIVEEIIRIYGLDALIPKESSLLSRTPQVYEGYYVERKIEQVFLAYGFTYVHTHAFTSQEILETFQIPLQNARKVKNPLSEDLGYLRTSLIPPLLYYGKNNTSFTNKIDIFEMGNIFSNNTEAFHAALLSFDKDYFALRHILDNLFAILRIPDVVYSRADDVVFSHKGKTAHIMVQGEIIGTIGVIHPQITLGYDIPKEVSFAEIYLEKLSAFANLSNTYTPFSRFQRVTEDINFEIGIDDAVGDLLHAIQQKQIPEIRKSEIIDIYRKDTTQIVTIRIHLQSDTHTLAEHEISAIREKLIA